MGVRRIEDLVAFQFADEFASAVFALLRASPKAENDFRFVSQLTDATTGVASSISEGFHRILPSESAHFLRYALASLAEAEVRLQHGARRRLYTAEACAPALVWADRCRRVTGAYRESQLRLADKRRRAKRRLSSAPPPAKPARRDPQPKPRPEPGATGERRGSDDS